jgi:hypothetical protein
VHSGRIKDAGAFAFFTFLLQNIGPVHWRPKGDTGFFRETTFTPYLAITVPMAVIEVNRFSWKATLWFGFK